MMIKRFNKEHIKRLCFCLIATSLLMSFTGCGKKDEANNQEPVVEIDDSNSTEESVITIDDGSVEREALNKQACKKYDAFLDGEEPLYFTYFYDLDNSKVSEWKYSSYADDFDNTSPYLFEEFMEICCKSMAEDAGTSVYPENIETSLIDCGDDGVSELAIRIGNVELGSMEFTDVWVIKYIEDKLQLIFYRQYGYRADMDINEYGYIWYGGSSGAANYGSTYEYLNENGELLLDYSVETILEAWGLYTPDNDRPLEIATELGIEDNIEINGYYFERFDGEGDYGKYQQRGMWTYAIAEESQSDYKNGEQLYKDGNPYKTYWDSTKLPLNSQEEVDRKIADHRKDIGLTERIVNGNEAQFKPLSKEQFEKVYAFKPEGPKTIVLDEPSWEYYCGGDNADVTTSLSLKEVSKSSNGVTDEDKWFASLGIWQPDRLSFSDDKYDYKLYGEDSDGLKWYPFMLDITNSQESEILYTLDFSNYYKPPFINPGDESFVEEAIGWATIEDGILYVSTFHNTYASSAAQNGYITALDMNDGFKVLWRSEPLTCNASNFVIEKDAIICGYGFTAEDDFVYVLDKNSGKRVGTYKVKTGPEWFCVKDNQLYVRCYDTDYVFSIN